MPETHKAPPTRVRVDAVGRVVIPINVRQSLSIEPGQDLLLSEDGQGIRLQTFEQAVQAVQAAFAPYRIPGVSVVDQLIAEREKEACQEHGE